MTRRAHLGRATRIPELEVSVQQIEANEPFLHDGSPHRALVEIRRSWELERCDALICIGEMGRRDSTSSAEGSLLLVESATSQPLTDQPCARRTGAAASNATRQLSTSASSAKHDSDESRAGATKSSLPALSPGEAARDVPSLGSASRAILRGESEVPPAADQPPIIPTAPTKGTRRPNLFDELREWRRETAAARNVAPS